MFCITVRSPGNTPEPGIIDDIHFVTSFSADTPLSPAKISRLLHPYLDDIAVVYMPYTPPSQQSPASSRSESPSRRHPGSFVKSEQVNKSNDISGKPGLPRSSSSTTTYLLKHRRSPSFLAAGPTTPNAIPQDNEAVKAEDQPQPMAQGRLHHSRSSLQSKLIAIDITTSPPDSSSDEDVRARSGRTSGRTSGRIYGLENLAELQAAIRLIEQHRESSPNRAIKEAKRAKQALGLIVPDSDSTTPSQASIEDLSGQLPLSKEARKISHSRSCTESAAGLERRKSSPGRSSSGSDLEDEDDGLRIKPSMVRKKSGELVRPVLRPASIKRRPSSMPGTPTYSKAVHFDSNLEHVRHFLQVDRPLAVSAGTSPVGNYDGEMEFPFSGGESRSVSPFHWEIRLANFPRETLERRSRPVMVEQVCLSPDNKTLIGTVAVQNLAFHKLVVTRFTLDYWKTTSEVVAEYSSDVRRRKVNDGLDRFNFSIRLEDLANLESKTLFFCVRYNVNGQEFWDNNQDVNFQVDFTKKFEAQNGKQARQAQSARPLSALPRSRPSSPGLSNKSSTTFDDFSNGLDSPLELKSFPPPTIKNAGESPIRFKNKSAAHAMSHSLGHRASPAGQAFGNRYDFGASLSAAIQAAGGTIGDQNGAQSKDSVSSAPAGQTSFEQDRSSGASNTTEESKDVIRNGPTVTSAPQKDTIGTEGSKPAALTSGKPPIESPSYHELLNKYCFVRSRPSTNEREVVR